MSTQIVINKDNGCKRRFVMIQSINIEIENEII